MYEPTAEELQNQEESQPEAQATSEENGGKLKFKKKKTLFQKQHVCCRTTSRRGTNRAK